MVQLHGNTSRHSAGWWTSCRTTPTRPHHATELIPLLCWAGRKVFRFNGDRLGLMVPLLYSKQARSKEGEKLLQARLCCVPNKLQVIKWASQTKDSTFSVSDMFWCTKKCYVERGQLLIPTCVDWKTRRLQKLHLAESLSRTCILSLGSCKCNGAWYDVKMESVRLFMSLGYKRAARVQPLKRIEN